MHKVLTIRALLVVILGLTATVNAQEIDRPISLDLYQAPVFLKLPDQPCLLGVAIVSAEDDEQRSEKPPLSANRFAGEILAGVGFGVSGSLAGGYAVYVGYKIAHAVSGPAEPAEEGDYAISGYGPSLTYAELAWGIAGVTAGSIFGSAVGVYFAGTEDNVIGSFSRALLGSIVGYGASWLLSFLLGSSGSESEVAELAALAVGFGLFTQPIGAAFAFNRTRRYKSPPESALINVGDGQLSLAVPTIYSRPDAFGRGSLSRSVGIIKVRF